MQKFFFPNYASAVGYFHRRVFPYIVPRIGTPTTGGSMSKVTHHSPICGAGSELTQLHRTGQQFRWSPALVWDRKLKRLSSFWKVGSTFRVTATHDLV